ncbi:MAG: hypothetical protein AB1349_07395, partial [Elusimicrobiota bacterium]
MKCRSKKQEARSSNWQWFLVFLITCFFLSPISNLLSPICLYAEDAEIKLNTSDGSSCFVVQDKNAAVVSSITSVGNAYFKGNVGIGTIGPAGKLSVQGQGSSYSLFVSTASDGSVGNFVVTNSGNVGIGTTGPAQRLDVTGHISLSGNIIGRGGSWLDIYTNTLDGSDTKATRIGGGGDVSSVRGAVATFYGNEHATWPGVLELIPGTGGDVIIYANVGIGTTGPEGRLHVLSDSTSDKYVLVTSHTVSGYGLVVSTS